MVYLLYQLSKVILSILAKVLITHDFGGEQSSEVIDLRNADNVCGSFDDVDTFRQVPFGALMQKSLPVVCGGYSPPTHNCVIVGKEMTTPLIDFILPRPESGFVLINESTLWITGAEWGEGASNSEYITVGSDGSAQAMLGPEIPLEIFGHCMVKVDEHTFFMTGGRVYSDHTEARTYFYDMVSRTWTLGPDMNQPRAHHRCEVFRNPATNSLNIIVMGGYDYEHQTELDSVELLDLDAGFWSWTLGPPLPVAVTYASSVSLGDSVISIGGEISNEEGSSDQLHELICTEENGCFWETLPQTLKYPRWGHVAMLIPDDLAGC